MMRKAINTLLLGGFALALCSQANAQNSRTVDGQILEKTSNGKTGGLAGAVVETRGHELGTRTDEMGRFSFTVPDSISTIIVSFIGYSSDTLKLQPGDNHLKVTLEQPKTLKEVEVVHRQKGTEIGMLDPRKTEKIGQRELLKAACCNLSESFETTPSVDVAFTDAVSGYKQIQMLGLAGPYTLITRENIPDARGLSAITGLTFTPGTWIEGMQLSKGTGSVVNGYESVAGQINVELRKPFEEKEAKWLLNLYQSTQGRTEANVVHRYMFNDRLSTNTFLHARSQWARLDQNGDGFMDQPMDKQFVGANRWFWFGPKGWEIQGGVKGVYVDNTGGQLDYKKGTDQVTGNPWGFELDMRRMEAWAKIGHMFPKHPATSMGLQLSGVYHDQNAVFGKRNYSATQRSLYANLIFQSIIGNTNHVIKAGLSAMLDNYEERLEATNYNREEVVPGAFAEYAWTQSDKLNIVAGIRADHHNLFGAFVTPRLHMRYAPFKNTVFRGSIGRAQRTANIFVENMGHMASNRQFSIMQPEMGKAYGLDPEVAWNYGINLTQKFQLNYRDGALSVDYYYTDFENQVVVDIEDRHKVVFYNLDGKSFANSFQVQLDYEPVRKLDVRLAYRWYDVQTDYQSGQKLKPLVSPHRAFINLGYETKHSWKLDYTVQWVGSKRVPSNAYYPDGYESPSFIQMNAQISKTWKSGLEVYVGGENLTNYMQHHAVIGTGQPYGSDFDASLIWGPVMGRNVYAGVRFAIK